MSKSRLFDVKYNGKKIGTFSGDNAQKAGAKGFSRLQRKNDIPADGVLIEVIDLKDNITSEFECKRKPIDPPMKMMIGDKEITYSWNNTVKSTKYDN